MVCALTLIALISLPETTHEIKTFMASNQNHHQTGTPNQQGGIPEIKMIGALGNIDITTKVGLGPQFLPPTTHQIGTMLHMSFRPPM